MNGCKAVSGPPNLTAMTGSLLYGQEQREYHLASPTWTSLCQKKKSSSWLIQIYEVFHFLYTCWLKQVMSCISVSNCPVLCACFALILIYSHSTLIVWALCKPWKAFLHYSLLQQMFIFTTLLTLLAYLPLCKQLVLCSDCEVYFGQYFNKGLVWVCAY